MTFDYHTALDQLTRAPAGRGASRAIAMLGAHSFSTGKASLTFKFRGSGKSNACMIELTPADEYTVTFFKIRGVKLTKWKIDGLTDETLPQVFEQETGLRTSL